MDIIGLALTGLLMTAEQGEIVIRTGNTISPKYHQTDYKSVCGSKVFRVRFRNGPEENGRVDHLLIDGRSVRNAAETLQMRAARRLITGIEIANCGVNPRQPVFLGFMNLEPMESRRLGMRWSLAFRLIREGKGWRLSVD
jgi:hypothetical protein